MKKHLALYALLAVALIGAPALTRAEDGPAKKTAAEAGASAKKHATPFHGKVTAVDATAMAVTLAGHIYNVTSETKVMKAGKPATFADITVGEKITGQYKKTAAGKLNATVIYIGGKAEKTGGRKKTAKTGSESDKN